MRLTWAINSRSIRAVGQSLFYASYGNIPQSPVTSRQFWDRWSCLQARDLEVGTVPWAVRITALNESTDSMETRTGIH